MIHLPLKQYDAIPVRLLVPGALRQINKAILQSNGTVFNSTYYPHEDIVNLLKAFSIHKTELEPGDQAKCNYCESRIEHAVSLQVEHYRPKAKVESGENDHVQLAGYYWLGLEWSNLLLACPKCNGRDAKGNKFPIRGIRALPHNTVQNIDKKLTLVRTNCYANANPLLLELPILLNPEIDHPENFLTFNNLGYIRGHGNNAERGEISKDVYKLNRDELIICRQKVWNDFKNDINEDIAGHQANFLSEEGLKYRFRKISEKILNRRLPSQEYALWGKFINDNIQSFVVDIEDYYRLLFLEAYHISLNNTL